MSNWLVKGNTLKNYLQACKEADIATFKRDERFRPIFEHCNDEIADSYYRNINPQLFLFNFTNDDYGNPVLREFPVGWYSNSTMQYIGVLSNLIKYFSALAGLRICEIGGGYGGQARTFFDVYSVTHSSFCYHIIDLPEVCDLQRRYLKGLNVQCFTEPTGQEYDLVISNYALSEVVDNSVYIQEIIMKSKHGYLTCNTDRVVLPFEHQRYQDIEGERKTNYVLVW